MANRLSQEKANAIAAAYCTNGHKKAEAMITVGYTEGTARAGKGLKVYDNTLVVEAIARLEAESMAGTETTVKTIQAMYQDAYNEAKRLNQPSAMVSAGTGIARLYGMDKDNAITTDKPQDLTESELTALRDMARAATDVAIGGPKLAKEA